VTGIDLWTAPDAEPCEVRFAYAADGGVGDAVGLPQSFTVRHADAAFGTFTIDEVVVEPATENADSTGPAATAGDGAGAER
jgi:hypothetical protein